MCFGGGSSRPEPVSPTVTQEQKEQKKEETQKKVERRQEALEKEVTSKIPQSKHNLLMKMGSKLERQLYEEEEEEELYIQVVEVV